MNVEECGIPSLSAIIKSRMSLVYPHVSSSVKAMFNLRDGRDGYIHYLLVLHSMIRASVPVMEAALNQMRTERKSRESKLFSEYLICHIDEERGHDRWLASDLEVLGVPKEKIENFAPPLAVATMIGMQYYWIHHYDPLVIIGYIAAMEGNPPTSKSLTSMRLELDLPHSAFRTLLEHADIDGNHTLALDALIDKLVLSDSLHRLIIMNSIKTLIYASEAFDVET